MSQQHRHLPLAIESPGGIQPAPGASSRGAREAALVPASPDGVEDEIELLQVGDLARITGKTVRAIHLYEELGLLKPHARSKGRYRLFSRDSVTRVRWIGKLQSLGLSLPAIQSIVREWEASPSAPGAMALMRDVYRQKLKETREQLQQLKALEAELAESLRYLEACDVCDPERLLNACACCDMHDHDHHPPELVAGFRAS